MAPSWMQGDFHKAGSGMGQYDISDKRVEYGENLIKISVPPIMFLILHEVCDLSTLSLKL